MDLMFFSHLLRATITSCPQPRQRILKSIPLRSTRNRFSPHGCCFFITRISDTCTSNSVRPPRSFYSTHLLYQMHIPSCKTLARRPAVCTDGNIHMRPVVNIFSLFPHRFQHPSGKFPTPPVENPVETVETSAFSPVEAFFTGLGKSMSAFPRNHAGFPQKPPMYYRTYHFFPCLFAFSPLFIDTAFSS